MADPVVIDNTVFDILPPPSWSGYKPTRKAPKVKFQAEAGYTHQRERWPNARFSYELGWDERSLLTTAQRNTLVNLLDNIGSSTFLYVVPESLWPLADGTVTPEIRIVRVVDESLDIKPYSPGFFTAKITIEEL
jgi:hypothetical protein